ncbi:MAG: DUF4407 domain-containing protein [Candidatus Uhrbacteria bacterium]
MTLFLITKMGFDAYGIDRMSPRVKRYLGMYAQMIVVQFFMDWFLWTAVFGIALSGSSVSILFGFAMAFAILVLEVTIGAQDTTEGLKRVAGLIAARVLLMFVMSGFTSTVFDLLFFHDSIDQQITKEEKEDADGIRQTAIDAIEADYAARLADKKAELGGRPDEVKATSAANRATLVATQKANRADITKRLSAVMLDAVRESAGRYMGPPGAGMTTGTLTAQATAIRKELKDYDAAAKVELSEFDAAAATQQGDAVSGGQAAGDAVVAERDERIAAIRALSQTELAAAYPGDWVRSRGVMDQYRTLKKLIASDPVNAIVAMSLWVLGMIIPTVVLLLKFMAPLEVQNNFSKKHHAANGDPEAAGDLRILGFGGNIGMLGWSADAIARHNAVVAKRIELREKLVEFKRWFMHACAPDSMTHVSVPRATLTRMAATRWDSSVSTCIRELSDIEASTRSAGVELQGWPDDWEVEDPRVETDRVWLASDEDIERDYGWVSPGTPRLVRSAP